MIVAGFGFRRGTSVDSMLNALRIAGGDVMPDAIATAAAKVDEAGFQTLATRLNRPVIAVDAAALSTAPTLTQSPASKAAHNTGSVAEAAALSALNTLISAPARLMGPRVTSTDAMATCALAIGDDTE